jgi:type III secretory pathway lipoprotein EscJ
MEIVLDKELRGLRNDKKMTERVIDCQKQEMLKQLKGEMGNDMMAVLNGEKIVELGKLEKKKFQIKLFFRKIFRMF